MEGPELFVVLDLEATCDEGFRPRRYTGDGGAKDRRVAGDQEVIELPSVVVDARTLEVSPHRWDGGPVEPGEFREYVRPRHWPRLTTYCTELTGIRQEQVEHARPFADVLASYDEWLGRLGRTFVVVTCGDWDLKTMMPRQCYSAGIEVPSWAGTWVNVKHAFEERMGRAGGMMQMLQRLKIRHGGRHHSGLDDCRNIAAILQRLLRYGWKCTVAPHRVAPIERAPIERPIERRATQPVDPVERDRRRLTRALADIAKLERRRDAGEPLELNQLAKIDRADGIRLELARLG